DYFDKKAEKYAKITGAVFYRDKTTYPLKFYEHENPAVDFKGYKLIDRYPEFHYTINDEDVFELIKPKEDGSGLIRTFRIPGAKQSLYFVFDKNDGVEYIASKGRVDGNRISLTAVDAREFVITMTKKASAQ